MNTREYKASNTMIGLNIANKRNEVVLGVCSENAKNDI
jgi:hypothetical protein